MLFLKIFGPTLNVESKSRNLFLENTGTAKPCPNCPILRQRNFRERTSLAPCLLKLI